MPYSDFSSSTLIQVSKRRLETCLKVLDETSEYRLWGKHLGPCLNLLSVTIISIPIILMIFMEQKFSDHKKKSISTITNFLNDA